jgi:hypothetical protein
MNEEMLNSAKNLSAAAGLKRQRTRGNINTSLNGSFNSSINSNNNIAENLAEVNLSHLVEQVRLRGVGNQESPGFSLSPSLENLPVRDPTSPVASPRVLPYRNLYPKPLRRFGSLPMEAMGAIVPSPPKKFRPTSSMSNVKTRRSKNRKSRRMNRKSRRSGGR